MKKVDDFETGYDMLEHAIEYAFEGKMQLKFYEFLKYRKTKKVEVDAFLQSSTATEIGDAVLELTEDIKGGYAKNHKGTVEIVDSERGVGSTFKVILPVQQEE